MQGIEPNQNAAGQKLLVPGSPVCGVLAEYGRGSAHIADVSPLCVDNQRFDRHAYNFGGGLLLALSCPCKTSTTEHERHHY